MLRSLDEHAPSLSILAPFVLQLVAMILLGMIVIIRDGTASESIVNVLLLIAAGNALGGVGIAVTHAVSKLPRKGNGNGPSA